VHIILRLMQHAFVLSGGMLLAMLHNKVWMDSTDFDMYRHAHVQYSNEMIESLDPSDQSAPECAGAYKIICDVCERLKAVGDTRVLRSSNDQDPGNFGLGNMDIDTPRLAYICYMPLPGIINMRINLQLLQDKDKNGPRLMPDTPSERCQTIRMLIERFDMDFLKSMWILGKLTLLRPDVTKVMRCKFSHNILPLNDVIQGHRFYASGLNRIIKYTLRGCSIQAEYDGDAHQIMHINMCPDCLGPKLQNPHPLTLCRSRHRCDVWDWIKRKDYTCADAAACSTLWATYFCMS